MSQLRPPCTLTIGLSWFALLASGLSLNHPSCSLFSLLIQNFLLFDLDLVFGDYKLYPCCIFV